MSDRSSRRAAVMAKIEATYGTAEATFAATYAVLLVNPPDFKIEPDSVARKLVTPWMGGSEELPTTRCARLKFDVELVGSGAAGTPPAWGKLLRGCGFAETIVAGNRVEYTPVNAGFEGLTFRFFLDGVRYLARGGRGTVKLNLGAYTVPTASFEFMAFDTQVIAAAVPTIDLTAFLGPEVVTDAASGSISMGSTLTAGVIAGGTVLTTKGISIDVAGKLVHRKLLGGESIRITNRGVSGQIAADLSADDEVAWRAAVDAVTLTSFGFQHGSTAGKCLGVFGARVQRTNPQAYQRRRRGDDPVRSGLSARPLRRPRNHHRGEVSMSNSEDLEALFPLARETTIAGVAVSLGPLKVRQFGAFSKVAEPFAGHVISGDYLAAVVQHPDAVISALEIATGLPAAVFDDMLPDETMLVLADVMEINPRFSASACCRYGTYPPCWLGDRMPRFWRVHPALRRTRHLVISRPAVLGV